jgi:hypothetical protein
MARPQAPEMIVENGKIINADQLRSFWQRQHHRDYILRRATFDVISQSEPSDIEQLSYRVNNLEAISAEPGRIPRQYENKLEQIQGQVLYLQNKYREQIIKKKPEKKLSNYKGIEIE